MSRDEMAKELHGYVMTCIEGYIKKSFLSQFNGQHIMQKKIEICLANVTY